MFSGCVIVFYLRKYDMVDPFLEEKLKQANEKEFIWPSGGERNVLNNKLLKLPSDLRDAFRQLNRMKKKKGKRGTKVPRVKRRGASVQRRSASRRKRTSAPSPPPHRRETQRWGGLVVGGTSEPARLSQCLGVVWFGVSCRSSVPRCAPLAVVARTHRDYALSARGQW